MMSTIDFFTILMMVFAVLMMGSPLSVLCSVLREKSTSAMPFHTSLATWGNAFSWSLYGLFVAADPLIYGPNMFGLLLATVQLSLFVVFGVQSSSSDGHYVEVPDPYRLKLEEGNCSTTSVYQGAALGNI